jgi:hypothetical protein
MTLHDAAPLMLALLKKKRAAKAAQAWLGGGSARDEEFKRWVAIVQALA